MKPHSRATAYLVAIAALAVAFLLRWSVDSVLGDRLPLVTLFGAVAVAVWAGGLRPAILVAVVGYFACAYAFIEPRGGLGLGATHSVVGALAYFLTCSVIIGFGNAMRTAQRRYAEKSEHLRTTLESIGDAVISTDVDGRVVEMNTRAEALTQWTKHEAAGKDLATVFRIDERGTADAPGTPDAARRSNGTRAERHTVLIGKSGGERLIDHGTAPIHCRDGQPVGSVVVFRDSTERRLAESQNAERLAAARFLASIVESSDDAIVSKSWDGTIQSWNAAAERLFGYTSEQALGKHISLIVPRERTDEEDQIRARIRAGETIEHFDTIRLRQNGIPIHVSLTVSAIRDEAGRVVGASMIARDITERRIAEETLRQSRGELADELRAMSRLQELSARLVRPGELEPLLEDILAASADLTGTAMGNVQLFDEKKKNLRIVVHQGLSERFIACFSDDGWMASCSEAALRLERVILPDVHELTDLHGTEAYEVVIGDGIRSIQSTPLTSRDGRLLGMLNNHYQVRGGPTVRQLGTIDLLARQAADLIERHHAEAALHRRERWRNGQRNALRSALNGEPLQDSLGLLVRAATEEYGEAARAAFYLVASDGASLRHIVGMPAEYADAVHRLEVGPESLACRESGPAGEPVITSDVSTDPGWSPFQSLAQQFEYRGCWTFPIRTAERKLIGALAMYWTSPREASHQELEFVSFLTQTASIIIARHNEARERRQATEKLREADRRKDEFLAMLAHELRNPLAPIRNAAEILRTTDIGADAEAIRMASGILERQVSQMTRLVDDLLDMSRITLGKINLRRGRVELAAVVHDAVEAVSELIQRMEHELEVSMTSERIVLNADPARLSQVLTNLLSNACKFMDRGGRVTLSVEREQDTAVIRVRDRGIGIAPDELPHVFELFMQIDTSLERSVSGLGIGLTLVKELTEMHGGSVEAHSDGLGNGCEFVVRLPIVTEDADRAHRSSEETRGGRGGCRVLIVDDHHDSAESLSMLLKLSGHQTQVVHDGLEAIAVAQRFRPHVVLLDIGLPTLNGFDACRRIRAQPWGKRMMVVAVTGWSQEADHRKSREAGFDHHMVKPIGYAALMSLFDSAPLDCADEAAT